MTIPEPPSADTPHSLRGSQVHRDSSKPRAGSDSRPIQRLAGAVIDQIAAGEVVERPASVVKELVENALDAGAERIRVEILGGGLDRITVRDDGTGMTPEQAHLALERHATSKLVTPEDLESIATFGFRGEALPAIASVSEFTLLTRARGAREGVALTVRDGRSEMRDAPAIAEGTRVDVANLFGAIPARRKFLKQPATEWRHIIDWLTRAALARPDVHFDITRDGRAAATWPAVAQRRDRVAAVLSSRDSEAMVEVAAASAPGDPEHGYAIEGFCSRPDAHRAGAQGLYLFVNGRPVRDRLLRHALLEVYRDVLPKGRFPSAVLFLSVPHGDVDVNVHPAKWEVRFRDPRAVHRFIAFAVRRALEHRAWLGGRGQPRPDAPPAARSAEAWTPLAKDARADAMAPGPPAQSTDWVLADAPLEPRAVPLPAEERERSQGLHFADLILHGQLHATYLLVEGPDGLLLVDQHAAHERVLYERLRAQWREGHIPRQQLLLPVTVSLTPADHSRLAEHAGDVDELGFELEPFDESAWVVRAVPALLADRDPEELLVELADAVGREAGGGSGPPVPRGLDPAEALFATLACHSARRAGDRLEPAEQRALLREVDSIPWSPTCPHGRPVAVPIPLAEIERRFRRT